MVGLLVGLVFIGLGPAIYFSSKTPGNMSAAGTGTVTSLEIRQSTSTGSQRTGTTCSPVAQFAVGGQTYTARMSGGQSPCPWTVGQQIAIAYDPASPTKAMIPITGVTQFLPWIFTLIGTLPVGAGLRAVWRKRRL